VPDVDPALRHNLDNLLARMLAAAEGGLSWPMEEKVHSELLAIVDLIEALAAALQPLPPPRASHE
jgi:hypothetical protein